MVLEVPKALYSQNQNYNKGQFTNTASRNTERRGTKSMKKSKNKENETVLLENVAEIRNIYHEGWIKNLLSVVFPKKI